MRTTARSAPTSASADPRSESSVRSGRSPRTPVAARSRAGRPARALGRARAPRAPCATPRTGSGPAPRAGPRRPGARSAIPWAAPGAPARSTAASRSRRAARPRRCASGRERAARTLLLLAQERGIASVHVRRERLAVQRVAVVPHRDEAESGGRGVDHRAVADDRQWCIPQAAQEGAIPVGVGLSRVEAHDRLRREHGGEGRLKLLLVAVVGHSENRAATDRDRRCRRRRHRDGPGADPVVPVGIGDRDLPHDRHGIHRGAAGAGHDLLDDARPV